MMTCGDSIVRRGRTVGCGVPLLCLGGSDSPAVRRRVSVSHKVKETLTGEQYTCVKKQALDSRGRVKGLAFRRASARQGRSTGKTASLRRVHSELIKVRPEVVLATELVNSDGGRSVRSRGCEGSDPLYDVPVPRVAKVTRLRRSSSVVNSSSRDVSGNGGRSRSNTLHSTAFVLAGERKTKIKCKESSLSHSCVATKDLWYNKLCQVITEERDKEPPSTTIQVTYYDPVNSIDFVSNY